MKRMTDNQVAPLLLVLKQNPKDTDTMVKVGGYYFAGRQFDNAARYWEMAASIKPSADALTKLANAQYYGGSGDKAIASLNQALQLDPKSADALFDMGMLQWQVKGDVKAAIASWETLVKTNPNHPQIQEVKKMIAKAKDHAKVPPGAKSDKPAM
jgi:cytochrome c-type biogenesis protein CcmH/NrfG